MSSSHHLSRGVFGRLLAAVFAAALALALLPILGVGAQEADDREIDGEVEEEPGDGERVASTRFAGAERFSTAALIAVETYAETSTAIVARHNEFADALAGGYLAGQIGAPILLVSPNDLQESTLAAMDQLGVDNVILLGQESAISASNANRLSTEEDKTVARIGGETRFETARDIALRDGNTIGTHDGRRTAFLATGITFADALSAGPLAAASSFPIILTPSQSLHPAAAEALTELDIEQVIILGQTSAISEGVADEVRALLADDDADDENGENGNDENGDNDENGNDEDDDVIIRLGGTTRIETADEVARFSIDELGFTADNHGWARGNEFADALAIGPRLGEAMSPVLLTATENRWDSGENTNAAFAEEFECDTNRIDLAGGTAAISEAVADEIRSALGECTGVTLIHDTHFHGNVGPEDGANIARYMALAAERKAASPGALFIGNGDDLAPSVMASVFRGEHMIELLNASPLDVNTLGNHEFDFGPENLRERIEESDFAWVTANVRDVETDGPFAADLGVQRFILEDIGGVSVGVTGLGPEGMAEVTSLGDDTYQMPAIDAMEEVVPIMQAAGADLIVVASHLCGSDARDLAAAVDGIDVIVGDHCSQVLDEPEVINNTLLSFVGDEFDFLGELRLNIRGGDIDSYSFTLHEITGDMPEDPTIREIVDFWEAELDEALNEEIGFRTNDWDVRSPVPVRSEETPFANYITDAMRASVGADIALQNGGGIRSDMVYEGGEEIILRDVIAILPFPNRVVMVEITGENLKLALENGVSRHVRAADPDDNVYDGRFPHVSGMSYTWDASNEPQDPDDPEGQPGERITNVMINGVPLDPNETYTLATNDFLLGGGDGYFMLADGDVLIDSDGGVLLSTVVTDQIRDDETVTVSLDGRITEID